MFASQKRQLADDLAELRTKYAAIRQQLTETKLERDAARWEVGHLGSSQADLVITRTRERDQARRDLRDTETQLGQARQRIATGPTGPDAWKAERTRLVQRLDLSERARASLDGQMTVVQDANDALCREAVDRAGNLTRQVTA